MMYNNNNTSGSHTKLKVSKNYIKILQINLHHSKSGTACLCRALARMSHDYFCLIQEPYSYKGKIRGLGGCGTLHTFGGRDTQPPRSCIITSKGINSMPLLDFCNRDVTAILTQWSMGEVVISSIYMDGNQECPPEEMKRLVNHCETNRLPLLVGSDANAHHTLWGSTNINDRGTALLEYLSRVDLHPINRGHRPTFVVANRKEVLDVTLVSSHLLDCIISWRVDDEETLSDHRYIRITARLGSADPIKYRDKRKTDWVEYNKTLSESLDRDPPESPIPDIQELEASVDFVHNSIMRAYDAACPEKTLKPRKRRVPWWSPELTVLRQEARRLYRRTRYGGEGAWVEYQCVRNKYNNELRKRKTSAWREYCESIEDAPTAARLSRVLRADNTTKLGALDIGNGIYTKTIPESYAHLLKVSFPAAPSRSPWVANYDKDLGSIADKVVTAELLVNAIKSFSPYKAEGMDGIFPALLQYGLDKLSPHLLRIMRGCLTFGYVPLKWRKSRVVFLPKPGKESYELASAWRPISLTSFLLKTLERMLDWYIRKPPLIGRLVKYNQFAYLKNVSTEAALHQIVSRVEKALDDGEYCLAVFLDVKGAFNEIGVDNLIRGLRRFRVHETCVRFVECMLRTRTTYVHENGIEIPWKVEGGCPQGGVLSPLLWNLVVSEVLEGLIDKFPQLYSQGYADDLSTLGRGIDLSTVSNHIQMSLDFVSKWCRRVGLSVNDKLSLILFTKRLKFKPVSIRLEGKPIPYQRQVKYLGVILDNRLSWGPLTRARAAKGGFALAQCRRAVSKTWGLTPKITRWIYLAVVRPAIEYASVVWVGAVNTGAHLQPLERVHRTALLAVTGAMNSTPTAALNCLLDIRPMGIRVKQLAVSTSHRLTLHGQWKRWQGAERTKFVKHNKYIDRMGSDIIEYHMPCESNIYPPADRRFNISVSTLSQWMEGQVPLGSSDVSCFTDGSRMEGNSGASFYLHYNNSGITVRQSIPLGWSPSVYQAELLGIIRAVETLANNMSSFNTVDFYVDSLSSLLSLKSPGPISGLACEAIESLNNLGSIKGVRLSWIPAHKGLQGNEIADELAKEATKSGFIGPQPYTYLPHSSVRAAIAEWARQLHIKEWANTVGCKNSKSFIPGPSKSNAKIIISMGRKKLRLLTQILTGHCHLNGHLAKMGLISAATCECGAGPETVSHFLGACDRYLALRFEIFGWHTLLPNELFTESLPKLANFIVRSGRFESVGGQG